MTQPNFLKTEDKVQAEITVTVTAYGSSAKTSFSVDEYEFMKESHGVDLIYDVIDQLKLELQRGI